MNAEDWATAPSAVEEDVAAERVQFPRGPRGSGALQNARHAVPLAIRARIRCEAYRGQTEQQVPVLIAPAMADCKSEVAFHSALYAVLQKES
jgi:hypothetical protein